MSNPVDDGGYSFKARMFMSKAKDYIPRDLNLSEEDGIEPQDMAYKLANLYFHLYGKWPTGYGFEPMTTESPDSSVVA